MPARIYFYCHKAPPVENGGAVPVCNMRKVYQQLKKAGNKDVEDIMENGLRYMRTLHSRDTPEGALYSWQKTFPGQRAGRRWRRAWRSLALTSTSGLRMEL